MGIIVQYAISRYPVSTWGSRDGMPGGARLPSLGILTNLQAFDFEDNTLNVAIPSQLSGLAASQVLDLSRNRLTGVIFTALACLPALQALDILDNDISGEISE